MLTYEELLALAQEQGVDFDKENFMIDDFRKGIESEIEKKKRINIRCTPKRAAELTTLNLRKNPNSYASFIDRLRRPKFLKMAIFDWALTIIGMLIIVALTNMPFSVAAVGTTILGVLVHLAMGVNTQFGYYLGLNPRLR